MRLLLIALCLLISACPLQDIFAQNMEDRQILRVYNSQGEYLKLTLTSYVNTNQVLEVRIDASGIPKFNKMNPTLGYGRDLDGNGKIDTWFFITQYGIKTIQKEGITTRGMDILGDLIIDKYESGLDLYVASITSSILSFLFFTASEVKENKTNFYLDWINLEELSIHLKNISLNQELLNINQYDYLTQLLKVGYEELFTKMEKFNSQDVYGYVALDVGLWFLGGALLKGAGKILATPIAAITETSLGHTVGESVQGFFSHHRHAIESKLKPLKDKLGYGKNKSNAATEASLHLGTHNWKRHLNMSLSAYILKRKLMATAKNIFIGHKGEWIYIGLSTALQSTAEAVARYDDIHDPNPITMAGNLFGNQEVQQNIGFMTLDTLMMTAASTSMNTVKARFLASGLVALTNSTIINFVIKKEDNYQRIALDTSWESIIGNSQVQADLAALTFFEKLATKKNNPKLRLLGYMFVVVDQGTGYFAYSKASSLVTETSKKEVLVPILVE